MLHYIFGRIEGGVVTFVGCTKSADLPEGSILLQEVQDHPEVHWVKWSMRFRRTLIDKRALDNPFAQYFKNPARLTRLLGDEDFARYAAAENASFLKFHEDNPLLMDDLVQAARAKQAERRTEYSLDQLLGEVRWSDTDIDRGTDRFKINGKWSAWYSRALQMVDSELVGFFTVRSSVADALVWIDGRTWHQFAVDHEEIKWSDPFDDLPDSDWEYRE